MDRKEAKRLYKEMKPEMGVYLFHCLPTGKHYLGVSQDVKVKLRTLRFQLNANQCFFRRLQADWNQYGEAQFEVKIAASLDYDQDENKSDYRQDLRTLREIYSETLEHYEYIG